MSVQWQDIEFSDDPTYREPEDMLHDEIERLRNENAALRAELEFVRSQSSAGFARSQIKRAGR